ncbi:SDR family NAD(P)-dependent oxidoreductase [Rhodococcus sp. ARC_M6]|uniref:SDR family NAD(P)-dependent oxidoreductase n=1 Tax=Rhodococcus sp. ARC_M6 TaxID=2928852 RepID=UPI001FB47218|nr:SDR family NAD(P)-dependent oxidoreductase [Rhodococcus sp. ARC_M6]MCJ0905426.1 SDR family oxidoreductase [Rhodococcus sp. ARC_M6]
MQKITKDRHLGRRIVVSGGVGGIGAAAIARLVDEGAAIGILDIDEAGAQALAAQITAAGGVAIGVKCDVGDESSVSAATATVAEHLGGIDGAVTCAGIARSSLAGEMAFEDWDSVIRINLTGSFLVLKFALPHMERAGGGSVVTIGSVASLISANKNTPSYDASKAGVVGLTRSVAIGYADKNIRANCLCPGVVDTPLAQKAREVGGVTSTALAQTPLARRAEPAEMASIISFLLSDEASYITGSTLAADGGLTAQ